MYGTFLGWCWIPAPNEVPCESGGSESSDHKVNGASCVDPHNASVLIGLRLLGGLVWIFVSNLVGVISFVYFAYRLRRYVKLGLLTKVKPAVKLRFFYFVFYLVGTVVLVLQRLVLPQEWDPVMNRVQAFLQPSFSAFDAIVLLASERHWLLACDNSSSRHGTNFGNDLDGADHENRDEDRSHVNSTSNFDYGTPRGDPDPNTLSPSADLARVGEMASGDGEVPPSKQMRRESDVGPLLSRVGSVEGSDHGRLDHDGSSHFMGFEQPEDDHS